MWEAWQGRQITTMRCRQQCTISQRKVRLIPNGRDHRRPLITRLMHIVAVVTHSSSLCDAAVLLANVMVHPRFPSALSLRTPRAAGACSHRSLQLIYAYAKSTPISFHRILPFIFKIQLYTPTSISSLPIITLYVYSSTLNTVIILHSSTRSFTQPSELVQSYDFTVFTLDGDIHNHLSYEKKNTNVVHTTTLASAHLNVCIHTHPRMRGLQLYIQLY